MLIFFNNICSTLSVCTRMMGCKRSFRWQVCHPIKTPVAHEKVAISEKYIGLRVKKLFLVKYLHSIPVVNCDLQFVESLFYLLFFIIRKSQVQRKTQQILKRKPQTRVQVNLLQRRNQNLRMRKKILKRKKKRKKRLQRRRQKHPKNLHLKKSHPLKKKVKLRKRKVKLKKGKSSQK